MPPKTNPKKLNPLQLKTLCLFQELARHPDTHQVEPNSGRKILTVFPSPHGNHFHLGPYVVGSADATGLRNEAVWVALDRKGLAVSHYPAAIVLTEEGESYDTGMRGKILHGSDH
ncbi:hypothetical protein ACM64Y_05715 [Novispirillum sp. DQ9]|uniref:hypothetical protein n=1 Tax=Novispirillum sp. DQ9 TaxID=3398612 RepID=UPI003C7AF783